MLRGMNITHKRLLEVLHYDPLTGVFVWKEALARKIKIGDVAGTKANKYCCIAIDTRMYYAHRLAWFYVHKRWPKTRLDHKNEDKLDNSIANLRLSDAAKNGWNRKAANKNSKSGIIGAHPHQGKFISKICVRRTTHYLGVFDTVEQAHAAYLEAKRKYHKH